MRTSLPVLGSLFLFAQKASLSSSGRAFFKKSLFYWAGLAIVLASLSISYGVAAAPPTGLGQRVITNTSSVNVRASAAGSILGQQPDGIIGTTIGGPVSAPLNGTSYTWFNVNFDSGVDGWAASIYLTYLLPPTGLSAPANGATGLSTTPTL
jgi:hypothetical protein